MYECSWRQMVETRPSSSFAIRSGHRAHHLGHSLPHSKGVSHRLGNSRTHRSADILMLVAASMREAADRSKAPLRISRPSCLPPTSGLPKLEIESFVEESPARGACSASLCDTQWTVPPAFRRPGRKVARIKGKIGRASMPVRKKLRSLPGSPSVIVTGFVGTPPHRALQNNDF